MASPGPSNGHPKSRLEAETIPAMSDQAATWTPVQADPRAHAPQASPPAHKRGYQACLPCRRRKVRCDLGSVDAPSDPPCLRCRREKKQCVFTESRRKRKADDDEGFDPETELQGTAAASSSLDGPDHNDSQTAAESSAEEIVRTLAQQQRRASTGTYANRELENDDAKELLRPEIFNPNGALHLLLDVASRTGKEMERAEAEQRQAETLAAQRPVSGQPLAARPVAAKPEVEEPLDLQDPEIQASLRAWSSLRFVRAGWFTAREGIAYIQYFYRYLGPLTPISPPDFRAVQTHKRLLHDEPMLSVTLLTITSRFMKLRGPAAESRSFKVHDQLWEYLQGMIARMFWGQENFGGGFCGAASGATPVGEMEARRRGLRSLGTVESLLLLSDWLPRALHFNTIDDSGDLLLSASDDTSVLEDTNTMHDVNRHLAWIEPAVRSDRMCWSLVGMAYTLSFELGVFDSLIETGQWTPGPQAKTAYDPERSDRVGRLLLIYVTQTCGRLSFPNLMPSQGNETNFNFLKMDAPAGSFPAPYARITTQDKIQRAWAELTALQRHINTEMFESKPRTLEAIQTGSYIRFLQEYGPRLRSWKERFEMTDGTVPPEARTVLLIEHEYSRIFVHSLALQAVLENLTAGKADSKTDPGGAGPHTPPALFSSRQVDLYKQNAEYIDEVVNASRGLLRLAVDGLLPHGGLKHAPVRTHFRILSGAMFLLKTFALGAKESEVMHSLNLLDATVRALRTAIVDDVHLSLRIADLLHSLLSALRPKFRWLPLTQSKRTRAAGNTRKSATTQGHTSAPIDPNLLGGTNSAADRVDRFPRSLLDLNDSSTTFMPPPDYELYDSFEDIPRAADHHLPLGPNAAAGHQSSYLKTESPTLPAHASTFGAARPTTATLPYGSTHSPTLGGLGSASPSQSFANPVFSPHSSTSGSKEDREYWGVLGVQSDLFPNTFPLQSTEGIASPSGFTADQTPVQGSNGLSSSAHTHAHSMSLGNGSLGLVGPTDARGTSVGLTGDSRVGTPALPFAAGFGSGGGGGLFSGANPWTGPFGTEISESFEFLGTLGGMWPPSGQANTTAGLTSLTSGKGVGSASSHSAGAGAGGADAEMLS